RLALPCPPEILPPGAQEALHPDQAGKLVEGAWLEILARGCGPCHCQPPSPPPLFQMARGEDTTFGRRRVPSLWLCTGRASSLAVCNRLTPPVADAIVPPSDQSL